jgi:hypothetical protein
MNNRLLQNYLDLSVNSEAKNSGLSTPKVNIDKKGKNKKTKSINSQSANSDRDSTEYIFNKNYLKDHKEIAKLQNKKLDSFELNNFDNLPIGLKDTKPKLINSQQSNENNNAFDSITGLVVGPEQPHKILNEQYNSKLNEDYNYNSEYNYNNNSNYGENLTLNGKNQIISRVMNIDDVNEESTVEINRIPSFKKPKYSVSTIATQADMDKGSVIAERKDFKYRNQEMSDVESQILSIEVDLCSDIYSSIADWCQTKNSSNNNQQVVASSQPNPYADRVISAARQDFASVTVNDYVAFKNCLNFQLQAARAAAMAANQSDTDTFDNYKIEIIEKGADEQTAKSTIIKYPEQLSSFKPLACLFNQKYASEHQQQQAQPGRNRMIVRISSTKSSTRKGFGGETDPGLARAIENKPPSESRSENEPRKQISSSTLVSSSSLIPFSSTSCGVSTNADNSPTDRKKQAFFGLSKEADGGDSDEKVHKKLPKIILEAYRAAVASASSTSSANSHELIQSKLNTKSFPNNLYMYLDSMPYLKSCVHEELLNAKLIKDKLFSMNKQQASSTLKPIPDTNDTVTSSKLEESFNRCYELNAANLKAKEKLGKEESKIYENEINDPNTIYSQVSSNEDENYTGKSISEASSKTNSMCSSSSSSLEDRAENQVQKKILSKLNETKAKGNDEELSKIMSKLISISSSSSELQKEMASYNLKPNLDRNQAMCSKHVDTPYTKREESPSKLNGQLTKAERIKKMLEEEKAALNLAKKASPSKQENNYRVESPTSQLKSSFLAAFTSVVSKKTAQEHAFKEYNNSAYAKDLDESVEERVFKSNFFKMNKKRDGLLQNQDFNNEFESITIKSSFNKSNEGDEDEDSNGNGPKNVRFADDVSYI